MTATLQAKAQQTNVIKYTWQLCEALQRIDELKNGILPIDYVIESGKKYHKVVMIDGGSSRSVHCFIDKQTGSVLKSASWKSPAKGVRYDLRLIADREWLFENASWCGGYLYKRFV